MATVIESDEKLKEVLKQAMLTERRDLVRELPEEIAEDAAMSRAIAEGSVTPNVPRDKVFDLLESVNLLYRSNRQKVYLTSQTSKSSAPI